MQPQLAQRRGEWLILRHQYITQRVGYFYLGRQFKILEINIAAYAGFVRTETCGILNSHLQGIKRRLVIAPAYRLGIFYAAHHVQPEILDTVGF